MTDEEKCTGCGEKIDTREATNDGNSLICPQCLILKKEKEEEEEEETRPGP